MSRRETSKAETRRLILAAARKRFLEKELDHTCRSTDPYKTLLPL